MSGPNAGITFEYDSTVGVTGSPSVTAWADQSGNGFNLSSYSGNPTTGTHTINGLNALRFGIGATLIALYNAAVTTALPFTLYAVVQSEIVPSGTTLEGFLNLASGSLGARGPQWIINSADFAAGGTVDLLPHVFAATFKLGVCTLWVDGVQVATGDLALGGGTQVIVGAWDPSFWQGLIAHVFGFSAVEHSTSQREAQQNFLMNKWGLYTRRPAIVAPGMASRYAGQ